jgi:hypothetical protein
MSRKYSRFKVLKPMLTGGRVNHSKIKKEVESVVKERGNLNSTCTAFDRDF